MPGLANRPRKDRMRVLCVLSSSNQMYSGIGRNVFELARRTNDRMDLEFAIDDGVPKNTELVQRFGREWDMPVHVGRGVPVPRSLDMMNDDLPSLLEQDRWDLVECLCWANAATNDRLLGSLGDVPLSYTPHDQPLWTVPMNPEQAEFTRDVHLRVLRRADIVLCDSPHETRALQALVPDRDHCTYVPIGCDFHAFRPGALARREQILFVGDLAEPRKRFDRVLQIFERLIRERPSLRLVVIGNRSDSVQAIPPHLRHACSLLGYVDEETLRKAYSESLGFLLLSDFEAFGIPILEALAVGTPVFLTRQETTFSLFGGFRGAHFCPADNLEETFSIISRTLSRGPEAVTEAFGDRLRLQNTFDWNLLADRKWEALASCWFQRNNWAISA